MSGAKNKQVLCEVCDWYEADHGSFWPMAFRGEKPPVVCFDCFVIWYDGVSTKGVVLRAHTRTLAKERGDPRGSLTPHKAEKALRGLRILGEVGLPPEEKA